MVCSAAEKLLLLPLVEDELSEGVRVGSVGDEVMLEMSEWMRELLASL